MSHLTVCSPARRFAPDNILFSKLITKNRAALLSATAESGATWVRLHPILEICLYFFNFQNRLILPFWICFIHLERLNMTRVERTRLQENRQSQQNPCRRAY